MRFSIYLFATAIAICSFLLLSFQEKSKSPQPTKEATDLPLLQNLLSKAKTFESIQYDSSLYYYQKAFTLLDKQKEKDKKTWNTYFKVSAALANGLSLKADFEKAHHLIDKVIEQSEANNVEDLALSHLFFQKGNVYRTQNYFHKDNVSYQQSIKWNKKSIEENKFLQDIDSLEKHLAYIIDFKNEGKDSLAILHFQKHFNQTNTEQAEFYSKALYEMVNIFRRIDKSSARKNYAKIIELNRQHPYDTYTLCKAYLDLGITYYAEDSEIFAAYVDTSLQVFQKAFNDDCFYNVRIYKVLGVAYKELGDYKAIDYLQKGIRLAEKLNYKAELIGLKMNLASTYNMAGENAKSIQLNLSLLNDIDPEKEAQRYYSTYNNLGTVYMENKQFGKAEEAHLIALDLKRKALKTNSHEYIATSYYNLGQLYNDWEKYVEAEGNLKTALNMFTSLGDTTGTRLSDNYFELGYSFFQRKEYDHALANFQKSIKSIISNYDSENIYAKVNLNQALKSKLELLDPLLYKAKTLSLLYKKTKKTADKESATNSFTTLSQLIDLIRKGYYSSESKHKLMIKGRLSYEWAIEHALLNYETTKETRFLNEAFVYAEKSKYLLLNEAIKESNAKFTTLPDSLLSKELALKKKLDHAEKEMFDLNQIEHSTNKNAKIKELQESIFQYKEELELLNTLFKKSYPEYFNLQNTRLASLNETQNYLKNKINTSIIEYVISDEQLTTFLITPDSFLVDSKKIDSTFFQNLNTLLRLLNIENPGTYGSAEWKKDYALFCQKSHQLYQTLIEPIANQIPTDEIIIIPDRELGYLPFQILLRQEAHVIKNDSSNYRGLPYLFADKIIHYEYSSTFLIESQHNESKNVSYLGYAPKHNKTISITENKQDSLTYAHSSRNRNSLSPLKHNVDEIKEVHHLYGNKKFIGVDATKHSFLEHAKHSGILHLSMHGIVNDYNPLFSRLEFTPDEKNKEDSRLYAYELYNMHLNAQLTVLSACETGLGKLRKGEGIMSLSRAFKYAGCPNIVMSLWSVDDLSSKDIIVEFFKNIKAGKKKNVALEEARRFYLFDKTISDKNTHPFYWAPFVLIGDDLPIEDTPQRNWTVWVFGILGIVLLVSILFKLEQFK